MTIAEKIDIAKVSQFLAANAIETGGLYGGGISANLPRLLYMVRKNVERLYALDPSDTTLTKTANYMYSLCAAFSLKAQSIIGGGGSIAPIIPSELPNPIDFIVSGSSIIPSGGTGLSISNFIGYNVSFDRNGQPQYTTNPGDGSTYFSWDRDTGSFALLNGAAQDGERFRITPIG